MVSEIRKNKLNYVFDTFFDVNKDGSIEKNDFEEAIDNIARIRGYNKDDANYKEVQERFLSIWEKLRVFADTNKDNKVSREEWLTMWSEPLNDEWKKLYMEFMFRLQDTSGDGSIDVEEFTNVCQTFGIPIEESKKAFAKISNDGKTEIDIKAYETLWKEYFSSDDVAAAGNSIFGKVTFP